MARNRRIHVEAPRTGGGSVVGFLAVLVVSGGALALQAADSRPRMARTVFVEQPANGEAAASAGQQQAGAQGEPVEEMVVSSVEETAPLCDIDACSKTYRSFRASDCTFQPYEGPRKLCPR